MADLHSFNFRVGMLEDIQLLYLLHGSFNRFRTQVHKVIYVSVCSMEPVVVAKIVREVVTVEN